MRNLFRLIIRQIFIILFILLEGVSLLFLFQFNPYQKSFFVNMSRNMNAIVYGHIGGARDYLFLKEENQRLFLENTHLQNMLSAFTSDQDIFINDPQASDTLLSTSGGQYYYIPAEVINNSVNKQYNYITLNKGSNHGIEKDMAVISNGTVVGAIAGVSNNYSTVIPLLNRNFRVSSSIARNNYFGILEWDGLHTDLGKLREIPLHVGVQKGDSIVTSGYSAIFPPGIDIGTVESIIVKEG
ncbi:MAG: rod shape-determining protein MreC, partial [Bacteroidales bacterium]|nr:rod shape-determining protein MreC [Bacteroidales bacterium]